MPKTRLSNRRSCITCRRLHLKCDGSQPCTSCVQAKRDCRSAADNVQFRHEHNPSVAGAVESSASKPGSLPGDFERDNIWTKIPSKITFVNQNAKAILAESELEESSFTGVRGNERLNDTSPQSKTLSRTVSPGSSLPARRSPSRLDLPQLPPLWPISTRNEAMLICYFVEDLAPLFDFMDQKKHFETSVVRAASFHKIIKYAIFAFSAKMLSTTGKWDPVAADRYQSQCLQLFIPALLNNDPRLGDDLLCAATLILRLYDQMTESTGECRTQCQHVLDTGVFVRAQRPQTSGYSLCQAALFVAIRQELYLAVHTRTVPPRLAEHCRTPLTIDETDDDFLWTRRILLHTEYVYRFVYGNHRTVEEWDALTHYLDQWLEHRPHPFDPIWKSGDEDYGFPEMWYANDCHVGAQQYADVCRILLALHNPRTPTTGLDRHTAWRDIDKLVTKLLRRICGIALSNRRFLAAMSTAGMAIVICGDRLTHRSDQETAMEILEHYETMVQWPTLRSQHRLRKLWNI